MVRRPNKKHYRKHHFSCGEQALAVDVLKSAVQEVKRHLVHVRSADTLELKKAHLVSVAHMWRFCVRANLWHELCDVDPDAMADKLHALVDEVEYEQIVVAYQQMRLEELADKEEDETA